MKSIQNLLFLGFCLTCLNLFSQTTPVCENPTVTENVVAFPIDRNQILEPPPLPGPPLGDPPTEDYRLIFWVHGLGASDGTAWSKASTATDNGVTDPMGVTTFPARKTYGYRPDYVETGIEAAANELRNEMTIRAYSPIYSNLDPLKNLVIAHSQGTLVSREVDRIYTINPADPQSFGGIVSFGGPHLGARILNNRDLMEETMVDACKSLLVAPVLSFLDKPILNLFISNDAINQGVVSVCDDVAPFLPLFFKSFDKGTTQDYFVGAPKIAELNAQTTWTIEHKLGTYGVEHLAGEDSYNPPGLFWRTLSSTVLQDPENLPPFTADGDQALLNRANLLTAGYVANRNNKQLRMDELAFFLNMPCNWYEWITEPINCAIYDPQYWDAKSKRDAWQKGVDFMMNIDETWKSIIGAVDYESVPYCVCTKVDEEDKFSAPIPSIDNPADCVAFPANSDWDYCFWKPAWKKVRKESDGIVLRESAQGYPGVSGYFEMDKSNHFQMRNDSNTKEGLLWVYRSGQPGGSPDPFFSTPTK